MAVQQDQAVGPNAVNVEFFVVKDWLHLGVITEKRVVTRARARARPYGSSEVIRKLGPKLPGFQFWSVSDPRL
jgi:hypothetical protein